MIQFNKNSKGKIYLNIAYGSESFKEILKYLKEESSLNYKSDCNGWYGNNNSLYSAYEDLKSVDSIEISRSIYNEIFPKLQIKAKRKIFNPDLLKFPPIKGKHPYENFQLDDIKFFSSVNRGGIFLSMGTGKSFIIVNIINQLVYNKEISKVIFISPITGVLNLKYELLKFSDFFKEEDICIADRFNREPFKSENKVIIMTYRTFLMICEDAYKKTKSYTDKVKRYERKYKKDLKDIEEKKELFKIKLAKGMHKLRYEDELKFLDNQIILLDKNKKKPSQLLNFKKPVLNINEWIGEGKEALICLDESHYIANHQAKQTKALQMHKEFFEYRYVMSGTPADRVEKYFSQMKFLDENLIPQTYNQWLGTIAKLGDAYSQYAITEYKEDGIQLFLDKIRPYIKRRLTKECLDLPENIIRKNLIRLNSFQLNIYIGLIDQELNILKKEKGFIESKELVNKFPFLRQALDNPCLLKGKIDPKVNPHLHSLVEKFNFGDHSKLEVTDELLSQYIDKDKKKVILWDFHPMTIDQLAIHYKKYKPLIVHGQVDLKGKNKREYRDEILDLFKNSKEHNLLIASSLVLDTSATIIECKRQIYFSRDNKMTKYSQSMKRIHRIGQTEYVITNVLILDKSLDTRLDEQMETKLDINNNLFKKKYLTEEECFNIFVGNSNIIGKNGKEL